MSTKSALHDDEGGESASSPGWLSLSSPVVCVALICVVAFLLRYFYIVSLDHLLCQFGDAYFFLAGGSKLREFICAAIQAGNFNLLSALPPASSNGMVAMGSIGVADRLMVDGPIFPSYLALVQWLVGLVPGSLLFDTKAIQISLVNALLDSLTCLFLFWGTRATFGQRAGYLAAALFAVYPASIINTQSCYTEPFGCFVLAVWSWLVFKILAGSPLAGEQLPVAKKNSEALFLILGVTTGLLTLTRPPFVFLPVIFAVLLTALRLFLKPQKAPLNPRVFWPVMPLLAGMLIVFLPWLGVTHKATGHYSLFVNRLPAFNLYLGNQLSRDGWRAYPFSENIPETVGVTVTQILEQARSAPVAFLSMELRKIPRLWMGTWNEFQYPLFGIPISLQEVLHQVLFSLAVVGFLLLVARPQDLRNYDAAVSLVIAVFAVQSLYLAFEPISRYTMTSMPVIVMLAAYLISVLSSSKLHLTGVLTTIIALVAAMHAQRELIALLAILVDSVAITVFASCIYIVLLLAGYVALRKTFKSAALGSPVFSLTLGIAFALVAVLVVVTIKDNPEMSEWKVTLPSLTDSIRQEIIMPTADANNPAGAAYILLDMAQGQCPMPLNFSLSGVAFTATPIPWWQIQPNKGFLEALALSERAMASSLYAYRQWYVVPIPVSLIKFGATNTVTVAPASGQSLTIFGDHIQPGQSQSRLPSLRLASWTKAFCTYDHLDGRVYETMATARVHSARTSNKDHLKAKWDDQDLSSEAGKQTGQYRIHLLVFPADAKVRQNPSAHIAAPRSELIAIPAARTISGADPVSMNLGESAVAVSVAPGAVPSQSLDFDLKCQLSSPSGHGWAFAGVQFQGQDNLGATKKWTSNWQPYAVKTAQEWLPFYFADALPADIFCLHNLRVSVTLCPFYSDQLLLHQKQAIKAKLSVKDLTLTIGPRQAASQTLDYKLY